MNRARTPRYFIGLMSGTSVDAVDAALMTFEGSHFSLIAHHSIEFQHALRSRIQTLFTPGNNEIDQLGELDIELALLYSECVDALLVKSGLEACDIEALGSHGQTIRHRPKGVTHNHPFTLQIGDPNTLASRTGITVVADFRRKDIALGGQGAPLAPAFHGFLCDALATTESAVVNIGGIANISLISTDSLTGFDTGPGNGLMDGWIQKTKGVRFDRDGQWAAEGKVHTELLDTLIADPFFKTAPPKSTGKEYFHLDWLESKVSAAGIKPISDEDIQSTLCELTASSIAAAITHLSTSKIYICGGGVKNNYLMQRLQALLGKIEVSTTRELGIDPCWVEASAFAWLAKQTIDGLPGNRPGVTGAQRHAVLGGVYLP